MTIIEQIKAEIEKLKTVQLKRIQEGDLVDAEPYDKIEAYNELLSFLSTLEESVRPEPYNPVYDEAYLNEKIKKATESWKGVDVDAMLAECRGYDEEPVGEKLDVEIALYLNRYFLNRVKYDDTIDGFTTFDAGDMAKYFYDLGCRRTAEKYDEIEYNRQRAEEQGSEGLEQEIQSFWNRASGFQPKFATLEVKENGFAVIARHFAQWGAEHLADARKTWPNDLEEAAEQFYPQDSFDTQAVRELGVACFVDGAKWQKEQMMKDAVDAEVEVYEQYEGKATGVITAKFADIPTKDICGKVRIIIVKEG